jgi:hypothetical protein
MIAATTRFCADDAAAGRSPLVDWRAGGVAQPAATIPNARIAKRIFAICLGLLQLGASDRLLHRRRMHRTTADMLSDVSGGFE